jgi:hypothetical protein
MRSDQTLSLCSSYLAVEARVKGPNEHPLGPNLPDRCPLVVNSCMHLLIQRIRHTSIAFRQPGVLSSSSSISTEYCYHFDRSNCDSEAIDYMPQKSAANDSAQAAHVEQA